jgi:triacylglycerol lipase
MRRAMYPLFILGLLLLGPSAVDAGSKSEPAARGPECVILLHGLGRTSRSLNKMADALQAAGFRAVNLDYPSRKKTIQELAPETIVRGLSRCARMQARTVHFVTFIMNAQEGIDQTLHFLREGRFGARSPSAEVSSD